jgi:glutathionylspermidine synthase
MTDPHAAYDAFARRIVSTGLLTDPWIDGAPRFRQDPVILSAAEQRTLYRAAEDVAAVYDEVCLVIAEHPELLDEFFGLSPFQKAMWLASEPLWHGIARADVFVTDEGLAFAELNCDTPTGEAEAVVLSALAAEDRPSAADPNRELERRFLAMIEASAEALAPGGARAVGLVYPTEFTEDLSLVRLYKRWLEGGGWDVILGSPYNLGHEGGAPRLFDAPFSVMLRHYKTDWWGERASAWDDEEIPDTSPLEGPLGVALAAAVRREVAVVNPFGAVLPQNKRAMAFMWERIHLLSPRAQEVIQRFVPPTFRLEARRLDELAAERADWVIKSDYGAEGDEVVVGRHTTDEAWRAALAHARKGRWVAQRFFDARADAAGASVNHGVYLVAGEAAGLYARVQAGPTDDHALSAPVLIEG